MKVTWLTLIISLAALSISAFSLFETNAMKARVSLSEPARSSITGNGSQSNHLPVETASERSRIASATGGSSSNRRKPEVRQTTESLSENESINVVNIGTPMDPEYLPLNGQAPDTVIDLGPPMQPEWL